MIRKLYRRAIPSATNIETALQAISISEILGVPVKPKFLQERISKKFLLRDVDPEISLDELAAEITDSWNLRTLELARFTRTDFHRTPTPAVLVTILGHDLLKELTPFMFKLHTV